MGLKNWKKHYNESLTRQGVVTKEFLKQLNEHRNNSIFVLWLTLKHWHSVKPEYTVQLNTEFMRIIVCLMLVTCFTANCQDRSKYITKGAEQFQQEEYESALDNFNKEFKKNKSWEVRFWIASCYFKMKEFSEAKNRYLEIVGNEIEGPEIAMSFVNLGSCYRSLNQLDSAIVYYDRAIELDKDDDDAQYNKGQLLYYELGDFEGAKKCYNAAIKIDPRNWYYYQKRLEVNFASANFNEALNDLLFIGELNPKVQNKMNLAYCYSMLERYHEADSVFLLIYEGNDAFFLNNYGFNKFKLGDSKLAIETINKSLSLQPNNSYAYRNLALIAIDEKNMLLACKHLLKAQELHFKMDYGDEVDELIKKHCVK